MPGWNPEISHCIEDCLLWGGGAEILAWGGFRVFFKWPIWNKNELEKAQPLWASSCAVLNVVCLSPPQWQSSLPRRVGCHLFTPSNINPVTDPSWNQHSLRELSFFHKAGSPKTPVALITVGCTSQLCQTPADQGEIVLPVKASKGWKEPAS